MKLPSVYANRIDKEIRNNSEYYRGDNNINARKDLRDLKSLFDGRGFANRVLVEIDTKDAKQLVKLVLLKDDYFVTINNEKIYFDDILDYKIKK